jgi:tetratricopeptide (TPR) repeat protein
MFSLSLLGQWLARIQELAFVTATLLAISEQSSAEPVNLGHLALPRDEVGAANKLSTCTTETDQAPRQRATAMVYCGLALFQRKDYDGAIAAYDEAISLNPNGAAAFIDRGNAWQSKGYSDRAIDDYTQALRIDHKNAIAFYNRGIAFKDKGRWEFDAYLNDGLYEAIAIRHFNQAIALNPKFHQALNDRGSAYVALRQYARALDDFNQAIQIDSNEALYFKNRANALRFLGRYDLALSDYRHALTLRTDEQMKKEIATALKELSGL